MAEKSSIGDLLDCMICCERVKSPRMLPCQHILCFNCLGQYIASTLLDTGKDGFITISNKAKVKPGNLPITFSCPTCNRSVSCRRLSEIEKSLLGGQLLDALNSKENTRPKCEVCTSNSRNAAFGCVTCEKQFCGPCFEHRKCQASSHIVGKLIDTRNISCMNHELELRYQCVDCDTCICLDCYLDHHTKHKVCKIASVGAELSEKLKECMSLADGNDNDSEQLRKDIAKIKGNHLVCVSDALRDWQTMAIRLFHECTGGVLVQEEEKLAKKVDCIRREVEALHQSVKNVNSKMRENEESSLRFLKYKTEIENIFNQCNSHQIDILCLKGKIDQKKNAETLKQLKEQLLQKLGSLIDKDIEDRQKNKQSQDQMQSADADPNQIQPKKTTPENPDQNGLPLRNATVSGNSPSSTSSNASTQPYHCASLGLAPTPARRVVPANRAFSSTANEGMQLGSASSAQSWTLRSAQKTLKTEQASMGNRGSPSSQTFRHREYRLNPPQSVSSPHQLHNPNYEPNAVRSIRQSESDDNLHSIGSGWGSSASNQDQRGRKITIRDPKQGGKDITDEILRRKNQRRS